MGTRVGMNVTAYQEKEKNEETRTGKRRTGEERKQATDFNEAVCCPSAVVQGAAERKNDWGVPGITGTSRRPTAISTQSKQGRGPHHHVEAVVIGAGGCPSHSQIGRKNITLWLALWRSFLP